MDPVSSAYPLLSRSADNSLSGVSSTCTTWNLGVEAIEREDVEATEVTERDDGVDGSCCVNEKLLLLYEAKNQ